MCPNFSPSHCLARVGIFSVDAHNCADLTPKFIQIPRYRENINLYAYTVFYVIYARTESYKIATYRILVLETQVGSDEKDGAKGKKDLS
jgi:hypothetical protein